ncbi:hypothetical protein [Bacillus sp. FSL M8-0168]|uniref:hypothetical protein n=1 Tax=Bacillus sp. FSL M8-0168 TaxID=2921614 RepID=UPI000617522F|nr:hypothetical protein TH62_19835 [Bacillus sp. TH008]
MALSNEDVQRLNLISPATNDLKLGDIIQSLLAASGGPAEIPDGSITTEKLADGAVLNAKIGAKSVTMAKLGDDVTAALDAKLTASKAATQANSAATDVAGIVADFNALLAKLKTAKLMA